MTEALRLHPHEAYKCCKEALTSTRRPRRIRSAVSCARDWVGTNRIAWRVAAEQMIAHRLCPSCRASHEAQRNARATATHRNRASSARAPSSATFGRPRNQPSKTATLDLVGFVLAHHRLDEITCDVASLVSDNDTETTSSAPPLRWSQVGRLVQLCIANANPKIYHRLCSPCFA